MELKPITRLHEVYRIEELISASELSYVYTGHHIKSGDKCVIKEFFPAAAANRDVDGKTVVCRSPLLRSKYEELLRAFQNEIELLKLIQHPHIVAYKDNFTENGTVYLVEEYCPGETLEQYIGRKETIGTSSFFPADLDSALAYAGLSARAGHHSPGFEARQYNNWPRGRTQAA